MAGDSIRKENAVSDLVAYHFPEFFIEENPLLISFIEAYYEFLEQQGMPVESIVNLPANIDIDHTLEEFVDSIKTAFFNSLPSNIATDKRLLLKHIREFFVEKGTEKSFQFLFRILFDDTTVEFFYPSQYILRASDGEWTEKSFARGVIVSGSAQESPFKKFVQGNQFSGVLDNAIVVNELGEKVLNLSFSSNSVKGTPQSGTIESSDGSVVIELKRIIASHEIVKAGTGFVPRRFFVDAISQNELPSTVSILAVDQETGGVKGLNINRMGIHTDSDAEFFLLVNSDGTTERHSSIPEVDSSQLLVKFTTGFLYDQKGYFKTNRGFLSDAMVLQDNYYWQQFSYVLKVSETIDQWRDVVKKILHPAGMALFGNFKVQAEAFENEKISMDLTKFRIDITKEIELTCEHIDEAGVFQLQIVSHPQRNLFRDFDDLSNYWYRYEYWNSVNGIQPDGKYIDLSGFVSTEDFFLLGGVDTYDTVGDGPYQVEGFSTEPQTVIGNAKDIKIEDAIGDRLNFMHLGEDSFIRIETVP